MQPATAFLPEDRRAAIALNIELPLRASGSVLFADISGFTPLTEAFAAALGPRLGADAATHQLNRIYADLIQALHRFGGAVIGFSGDGMLCWFGESGARPLPPLERALLAASALQSQMLRHAVVQVGDRRTVGLAIKTTIASGTASRFVVGDPEIQRIDVLAGEPVERAAAAEQLARQGETLLDERTFAQAGLQVTAVERRQDARQRSYVVVEQAHAPDAMHASASHFPPVRLPVQTVRPWLLPSVYDRLAGRQGVYVGELRPAVALFARFGQLDYDRDAQASAKLDAYVRWVQQVLTKHGGALIQLTTGDKGGYFFAAFGAPIAHADNERRAATAAQALIDPRPGLPYRPRAQIGIAQGRMRVGPYGSETRRTFGVQGSAVNLAARLMMMAEAGQILVEPRAAAALGDSFVLDPLGERPVKGLTGELALFALGAARRVNPILAGSSSLPLVGRGDELALLLHAFEAVQSNGQGRIVRVEGDAGMGKSSLINAFVQEVKARGAIVAAGAGQSLERTSAYAAVRPMARWLLGLGLLEDASHETQIDHVRTLFDAFNPAWHLRLPLLGDLLDLPIPDNETTAAFEPQLRRQALIDLIVEIIERVARQTPTVLLLEDAHWLDEASLALAQAMAHGIQAAPVLALFSHRPARGEDDPLAEALARLPHQTPLVLGPLDGAQVSDLVGRRLAGPIEPLASALIERQTAGNPFFVDQLASAMLEGGHLQKDEEGVWSLSPSMLEALRRSRGLVRTETGWGLAPDLSLADVAPGLPDSIHGAVLTRFDRLQEADKRRLRVASVIGRRFTPSLLQAAHAEVVDGQTLAEQLDRLRERDFLVGDAASMAFKHSITQEVVYRSLLNEQRQMIHRQVGEALEMLMPQAVEQLAHHFHSAPLAQPQVRAKAIKYLDAATERARRDYANEAALHHLDRVLALEASWARWLARAEVLHILGDRAAEEEALRRLEAISEMPPFLLASAWAAFYEATSRYAEAVSHLEAALDNARRHKDRGGETRCLARLGTIAWRQGDYAEAETRYQSALSLLHGDQQYRGEEADARYGLGLVYRQQGLYDDALHQFEAALATYQATGNRQNEAKTLIAVGHVEHYRRNLTLAMAAYASALSIYQMTGDRSRIAASLVSLAQGHSTEGNLEEARRLLNDACVIHQALNDAWWQIIDHNELGFISLREGRLAEAADGLAEALALSQRIGDESGIAYTLLHLGQVRREQNDVAAAEALLLRGLAISQAQGDTHLTANYLLDMALVHLRCDRAVEAEETAARSAELFSQLGLAEESVPNLTTLALIALRNGDHPAARDHVHEAMAILDATGGVGVTFPQRAYWACSRILAALGDVDRAERCAVQARSLVEEQASRMADPALRNAFLENLSFNREIMADVRASGRA